MNNAEFTTFIPSGEHGFQHDDIFSESLAAVGFTSSETIEFAKSLVERSFLDGMSRITFEDGKYKVPMRYHHVINTYRNGFITLAIENGLLENTLYDSEARRKFLREKSISGFDMGSEGRNSGIMRTEREDDIIYNEEHVLRLKELTPEYATDFVTKRDQWPSANILDFFRVVVAESQTRRLDYLIERGLNDSDSASIDFRIGQGSDVAICKNGIGECSHCDVLNLMEGRAIIAYAKRASLALKYEEVVVAATEEEAYVDYNPKYRSDRHDSYGVVKGPMLAKRYYFDMPFTDLLESVRKQMLRRR